MQGVTHFGSLFERLRHSEHFSIPGIDRMAGYGRKYISQPHHNSQKPASVAGHIDTDWVLF